MRTRSTIRVIDPADPGTWPPAVMHEALRLEELCRQEPSNRPTTTSCELTLGSGYDFNFEADAAFRELFGSDLVALYHATRLLPPELRSIERDGLLVLDLAHRERRIDAAIAHARGRPGHELIELLRHSGPLHGRDDQCDVRLGMLHAVTPLQATFDHAGSGMTIFLERWGGEAIYWAEEESDDHRRAIDLLVEMSVPAIVEFGAAPVDLIGYAKLWPIFVGQLGGWPDPCHQFYLESSVPPERIVEVLTETSPRWPVPGDG